MSVLYHNPIADVNANLEGAYRREPRNAAHLTRGVLPREATRRRRGLKVAVSFLSLHGGCLFHATFARRLRVASTFGPRQMPATQKRRRCRRHGNARVAGYTEEATHLVIRQFGHSVIQPFGYSVIPPFRAFLCRLAEPLPCLAARRGPQGCGECAAPDETDTSQGRARHSRRKSRSDSPCRQLLWSRVSAVHEGRNGKWLSPAGRGCYSKRRVQSWRRMRLEIHSSLNAGVCIHVPA